MIGRTVGEGDPKLSEGDPRSAEVGKPEKDPSEEVVAPVSSGTRGKAQQVVRKDLGDSQIDLTHLRDGNRCF